MKNRMNIQCHKKLTVNFFNEGRKTCVESRIKFGILDIKLYIFMNF